MKKASLVHGRHLIADFSDCDKATLNNRKKLRELLLRAAQISRATVLKVYFHKFSPQGVSGVVVIAESHIAIHTWPELGFAAIDIFTCGKTMRPELAIKYLAKALKVKKQKLVRLNR